MFSEDNLDSFSLSIKLPCSKEKDKPLEQFLQKYPLHTLKIDEFQTITIALRELVGKLPKIHLSTSGVSLLITEENLFLEIKKTDSKITSKENDIVETSANFSEHFLQKLSSDFNFILAGIFSILNSGSLSTTISVSISKTISEKIIFDNYFSQNFWKCHEGFEEKHVSGLQIDFKKQLSGMDAEHMLRVYCNDEKKDNLLAEATIISTFKISKPVELFSILNNSMENVNIFCKNLLRGL